MQIISGLKSCTNRIHICFAYFINTDRRKLKLISKKHVIIILTVILVLTGIILINIFQPPGSNEHKIDTTAKTRNYSNEVAENSTREYINKTIEITDKYDENDIAFTVNGEAVTVLSVKYSNVNSKSETEKKTVKKIVQNAVINQEAKRLKLKANEEKVNAYRTELKKAIYESPDDPGIKSIIEYIDKSGLSKDEYIELSTETVYNMWERAAYYDYLDSKGINREKGVKKLVKKAKIKAVNPDYKWVEKMY